MRFPAATAKRRAVSSARRSASAATAATRYGDLVRTGALEPDAAQADLVDRLDRLATELVEYRPARRAGPLGWLLGGREEPPPQGLYIWGGVGRGKTMLMDLFYETLPVDRKRRAHFHTFMADVHTRIHAWRQQLKAGEVSGDDPIRPVAAALAEEAHLLCFDEFAVIDIADAMILGRLFTALFAQGVIVVATSNVPPSDLYRDGLNRALFLPFVHLLEERTEVVALNSRTDFRMEKIGDTPVYFSPADAAADAAMDDLFRRLTGGASRPACESDRSWPSGQRPCAGHGRRPVLFRPTCAAIRWEPPITWRSRRPTTRC